jgi:hypothetical protein
MANMSYCRFENTSKDLRDCFYALQEAFEERDMTLSEFQERLGSEYERRSLVELLRLCRRIIDLTDEMADAERE